jgi:vacuolar protein sorting-associated protein 13A/C
MAKSLLLDVLVNVLGAYVDGLSAENLRVGVWSGKVELSNLKLKSTALDTLNLPIRISHGALKHLRLKIPWSHLESKPVRVVIDGVYLQCGPLDVSSLTVEELRARVLAGKRERLKAAMQAVLSAEAATAGSATDVQQTARQASYIQQLTTN